MDSAKLNRTVELVTSLLVEKDYARLEGLSHGVFLTANEMAQAVEEYGRGLVYLPSSAYSLIDVIEVTAVTQKQWGVNVPLFTESEGRSDLTLSLTLIEVPGDTYGVEIDDILVL